MNHSMHQFFASYWIWVLAFLGLLCLVYLITAIGLLLSSMRRNTHLQEQNEILRYQNDLLKWLGTEFKERHPPG